MIFISSTDSISSLSAFFPSRLACSAERIIEKIKSANSTRKIAPSTCPSCMGPINPKTSSSTAQNTEKGKSFFNVLFCTATGVRTAHIPITTIRLKILDPTTLLTASVFRFARDAVTETAASGSEVPIATMVSPMIIEGT